MITLEKISLKLGQGREETEILNEISLKFDPGKIYVITGPNGGGKTSIAKIIMGIYQPFSGKILYDGEDITGLSITERGKRGIRYAFQNPPRFKGIEIERMLKLANPDVNLKELRSIMVKIGLCPEDYLERMADNSLSGGEMKRLEVASVLLSRTNVAILDEPEAGVDLWGFEQLLNLVISSHRQAEERATIIISHSEKFLEAADEIIVVADGKIQKQGNIDAIRPLITEGIQCRWRKICLGEEENYGSQCSR
jgi:Fe-S cluster assembly ATP-binding protein